MCLVWFESDADGRAHDVADCFEHIECERVLDREFGGDAPAGVACACVGEVDWVEGCIGFYFCSLGGDLCLCGLVLRWGRRAGECWVLGGRKRGLWLGL